MIEMKLFTMMIFLTENPGINLESEKEVKLHSKMVLVSKSSLNA